MGVSRRAAMVDLGSLSERNLTLMLSELFHDGGITQERILVLFYFCADLAVHNGGNCASSQIWPPDHCVQSDQVEPRLHPRSSVSLGAVLRRLGRCSEVNDDTNQ